MGAGELGLVALIAVLVMGPKQWPQVMRRLGRAFAQARRIWQQTSTALQTELDEHDKQLELEDNERRAAAAEAAE